MNITPGSVILVEARFLHNIDHEKFALCLSECLNYYFFINSDPSPYAMDAQVKIFGKLELACLVHTSYIDTSKVQRLSPKVAYAAQKNGKVFNFKMNVIERIRDTVANSKYLPQMQINMILEHL